VDPPIHSIKKPVVMGRKQESGSAVTVDPPHQVDDQIGVLSIEISSWLISKNKKWISH
jgi:hypothetical protein